MTLTFERGRRGGRRLPTAAVKVEVVNVRPKQQALVRHRKRIAYVQTNNLLITNIVNNSIILFARENL